jgi:heat shock protein beta
MMAALAKKFAPLLEWLKVEAGENVRDSKTCI